LRELHISGGLFTWSNNHDDPILEKLDRILLSREWELLFPTVHGHKEPRNISDHSPLILSAQFNQSRKRRDFRFEMTWLKHPEFLSKINEIWCEPTMDEIALDRVLFKLKRVKRFLKGWGFNLARARKKRKQELSESMADLEIMEEVGSLNHDQLRKKVHIKVELLGILEEEELYWHKRSHESWVLKGDNNTKYFHRIVNGKKRKQTIYSLKQGDSVVQGQEGLMKLATEYYKELFSPRTGNMFAIDPNMWQRDENVTALENDHLT
jgi:hypothetical protein